MELQNAKDKSYISTEIIFQEQGWKRDILVKYKEIYHQQIFMIRTLRGKKM